MKKLFLILLAGYFLTLYGCPNPEPIVEEDPPPEKYAITGEVHMFNGCNEEGVSELEVKLTIELFSEGEEGKSVTATQTITLTPSSEDPSINVGSYTLSAEWEDYLNQPTMWGELIVESKNGGEPCIYDCESDFDCTHYDYGGETELIGTTTDREDYYLSCFCPE